MTVQQIKVKMKDSVYTPENIKLALMYCICNNKDIKIFNTNKLQKLLQEIIYEKRIFLFKENGIYLSHSLFIPYEIMDLNLLVSLEDIINTTEQNKVEKLAFVDSNYKCKHLVGVHVVVCGFLLCILELRKHNKYDTSMCIFDIILQSLVLKTRVNYNMLLDECRKYGYFEVGL